MALPNLLSLLLLSGVIVAETRKYLWEGNIEGSMGVGIDEKEKQQDVYK